jgi:hypothetical protein
MIFWKKKRLDGVFSEILKIIPKLDPKDLKAMQNALQSRFTKLTKSFGKGLVNVLKGGGIAGIALGLIDKLLNPLKEVQEAIDRTLKTSDDLATNANQFNTTTGKLTKLVTLAKATGLDESNLYTLINKFQGAVAAAQANPNDPANNSVKNFVGQKDTAEAFYGFITQLQKMDKNQQILIQEQVFGEKQILKMADFLQQGSEGFEKIAKITGIDRVTSDKVGSKIDKNAQLSDLADALKSGREFRDLQSKSSIINEGMIRSQDKTAQLELDRENQRIKSYNDLAAVSQTAEKIFTLVDQGVALIGSLTTKLLPFIDVMTQAVGKFMKSPMVRGIKGMFGGGKDE